jgi:Fe-S cluster assembly iron-binding protein IscA
MFTVSEKAGNMIKDFLKSQHGLGIVRVFLQPGCCGGGTLGMALDEQAENDITFVDQEITFVIDRALFEELRPIGIDFVESPQGSGFALTSKLSAGGGCSSSGCSTGGCSGGECC